MSDSKNKKNKKIEDQLLGGLSELKESSQYQVSENLVWNQINGGTIPRERRLWLTPIFVVVSLIVMSAIYGSFERIAKPSEFVVEDLRSDEYALEVYAALITGEVSGSEIYQQLDEGWYPNSDDSQETYAQLDNGLNGYEQQSSADVHPMDDIFETYGSSLYGQGLFQLANY